MTFQIKTRLRSLSAAERLCLIMGILFAASLIPLLILSFYAHPAGDDYVYGVQAHLTWEGTHSLIKTIKTADGRNRLPDPHSFHPLSAFSAQPAADSDLLCADSVYSEPGRREIGLLLV